MAASRRHATISNSSATTISTIGLYHASQLTGTNTDDTENDADDNDEVNSIASASTVPPSLIDGMTKYFTPASRQRKHSTEQSETALLKVVTAAAASSKLNKSMESNKSDASSTHKSTASVGAEGPNKKKQNSSSSSKKKMTTHENLEMKSICKSETESYGVGGHDGVVGFEESSLPGNLNNSDKENQSKQQLQQTTMSNQHQIRFDVNVSEVKNESIDLKKSHKNQKSKSNINDTDTSKPGMIWIIILKK